MRRVAIGATACRSGRIDGSARSTSRVLARQHDRRVFAVSRRAMDGGCRKGAELWRRLKGQGFQGSLRVVSEWATRRRRARKVSNQQLQKVPSARTIARLMTVKRDHMNKADSVSVAAIQAGVPSLVEAHALIERFHAMIRKKEADQLDPWIAEASGSLVSSFATGVASPSRGPMFRSRLRSPNSNSSNARCTAAQNSTFFKPDCSALHESANRHRDCVRAKSRSRHTLDAGRSRRKLTRRHQDVTQIHCDIAP